VIVLELLASRHFTGPAERIIHLMRGLSERGHKVMFAHTQRPAGTLAKELESEPFEVLNDVALLRKGLVFPGLIADVRRLHGLIARADDHVICHTHTSHDHWTAWCLAHVARSPISLVRSVHETRQASRRIGDVPLIRGTDALIAVSESMKETLSAAYGLDSEKVAVVFGSVDSEKFRPGLDASAIMEEIGANNETPVIGIVSRIKKGRGHKLLIEAAESVLREIPELRLMIVGRGESKNELEEMVRLRGLGGRVHFTGYRRDDLPQIYNAMTAKVILGEGSDGTCRAALEAMACGVPVIAARVGALGETVTDDHTGFLIDADDSASLARAMGRYASSPELAARHGAEARKEVGRRFSIDRMVETTESLFMKLSSGSR